MSTFDVTELEEMPPSQWDGKSRDMLVWNDSDIHELATRPVIGFINGHWITLHGWYDKWDHCAEIPKEMALTESLLEIARLQGEILKLKEEKKQLNLELNLLQKYNKQIDSDTTDTEAKADMESPHKTCGNDCGNSLVTGTIDESNEVLHACIADPKTCHCNNSPRTYRAMTNRELAEWLAKGNGQYRFSSALEPRFEYIYFGADDATVQDNISIRAWNEQIWHEPLIEE